MITIEPHIESLNGRAEGSLTFRGADGHSIHRASGNWMSEVTRGRCCRAVADALHPPPKPKTDEPPEQFEQRRQACRERHDETAREIDRMILGALDELQAETEQRAETAARLAEAAAAAGAADVGNGGNVGSSAEGGGLYVETDAGIARRKHTSDGEEVLVPLTNFPCRIVAQVVRDDGVEQQHTFALQARCGGREYDFAVPAADFAAMAWPTAKMGSEAIVFAGAGTRDHARVAIQTLSGAPPRTVVFTHTGWQRLPDGTHAYLHAGGAIGPDGAVGGVEVDLSESLAGYALPEPPAEGEQTIRAVRASLRLLTLARPEVVFPVFCAVWRAPLGGCDYALWLAGGSGVFKSELSALAQQHYGRGMDRLNLPANWSSTDNALEGQAFAAKDALLAVDDFAPGGGANEVQRLHAKADRLIRGAGNGSGRRRMRADGSLRPMKPPRCLVLASGEEVPRGHSVRGRTLVIEVAKGDIDPIELTPRQQDARDGLYAAAFAAYLRWLAPRYEQVRAKLRLEIDSLRGQAQASGLHSRTPDLTASLGVGLRYFLEFAIACGAVTHDEAEGLWQDGWTALGVAASRQAAHQQANEPAARFIELLRSALASGSAYVTDDQGACPPNPAAWGWRSATTGTGAYERQEWTPHGTQVGWVAGESLYLDADASYKAAQAMAAGGTDGLAVSAQTVRKRLNDKGLLIRETGRDDLFVRRVLAGAKRRVLHLPAHLLCGKPDIPDIPDSDPDSEAGNGDSMAGPVSGFE